jgi:hypothetical protein
MVIVNLDLDNWPVYAFLKHALQHECWYEQEEK